MNGKYVIPVVVAAGMFTVMGALPLAVAADQHIAEAERQEWQVGTEVHDAWLQGKLESALLFNDDLNSFAIDSKVENGTVYLNGAVESDIDRDLAGEIAKSIKGVTNVENELVVDETKAAMAKEDEAAKERMGFKESVKNATLTARIKTQLLTNSNTSGMAINVDSKQGAVTLSGVVKSEQEKDLAIKLASNTSGALSVNDQLVVEEDAVDEN